MVELKAILAKPRSQHTLYRAAALAYTYSTSSCLVGQHLFVYIRTSGQNSLIGMNII